MSKSSALVGDTLSAKVPAGKAPYLKLTIRENNLSSSTVVAVGVPNPFEV